MHRRHSVRRPFKGLILRPPIYYLKGWGKTSPWMGLLGSDWNFYEIQPLPTQINLYLFYSQPPPIWIPFPFFFHVHFMEKNKISNDLINLTSCLAAPKDLSPLS